ncbi:MAG: hypothetical protein V7L29_10210 [Nostoc sp.]|uniref:hypothetical protein n=1 Tax=Nostoc sp. TaxID=1180 RepID=UPI002FF5D29B
MTPLGAECRLYGNTIQLRLKLFLQVNFLNEPPRTQRHEVASRRVGRKEKEKILNPSVLGYMEMLRILLEIGYINKKLKMRQQMSKFPPATSAFS